MIVNGSPMPGLTVTRWAISKPVQHTSMVRVPGRSGSLDLSTALTGGEPTWDDRTLTVMWEEIVADVEAAGAARVDAWHGRELRLSPDGKPGYWQGRASIESMTGRGRRLRGVLVATVNPWRWDDALTTVKPTATTSGTAFTLPPTRFSVAPLVSSVAAVTVIVGTRQWGLPAGASSTALPGLILRPGQPVTGRVTGSGAVTFSWRGGRLL